MPRTYADLPDVPLHEAIPRGREDVEFFSHYFLRRKLHEGQAEWIRSAQATINVLPTGNRYGKTSSLAVQHLHSGFYKIGAEPFYMIERNERIRGLELETLGDYRTPADYRFDVQRYLETKYYTVHTAGL